MKTDEYHVVFQMEGKTVSEGTVDYTSVRQNSRDLNEFCASVNKLLRDYANSCISHFEDTHDDCCENVVVHIPEKLASSIPVIECEWSPIGKCIKIRCDATDENITITADRCPELKLSGKKVRLRTTVQNKARFELEKVAARCHPEDLREFCTRFLNAMGGESCLRNLST